MANFLNLFKHLVNKNQGNPTEFKEVEFKPIQFNEQGQAIENVPYNPMVKNNVGANLKFRANQLGNKLTNAFIGQQATPTDAVDTDAMAITTSENPRVGGILPDIASGFKENLNNKFSANNFGQNQLDGGRDKGFAYRLGEGLGTLARIGESPLGRGLIVSGLVGLTGGNPLQAMAYGATAGVGNQGNRMRDKVYRNQLKNLGMSEDDVNSIKGYITNDVYKNVADSYRARWNKASWADLATVNPVIAEAVKNNPELANSYLPASVANTILRGELTDAQVANLMARTKLAGIQGQALITNANANAKRADAYAGYMDGRSFNNDTANADLAEFLEIVNSNDVNKINFARNNYIKRHGKDPYKLIKN